MTNIKNAFRLIVLAVGVLFVGACKDAWEDHTGLLSNTSKTTLLERIAAEPELSKFHAYLVQTGLDEMLASSKTHTVWAPNNQAIDALIAESPQYLSSPENVKLFLKYHIATLLYPVANRQDSLRVLTTDSIYVDVVGAQYEEASVVKADLLTKNGILHIIDKALMVKGSVFYTSKNIPGLSSQKLDMDLLDTLLVNEEGQPVIRRSPKWNALVRRMQSRDSLYTYFVLSDDAYNAEMARITPYYKSTKTHRPDSTATYLTKIAMMEDLLVRGSYTVDQLPDTLLSVAGTKVPVKKSAIISTHRAHNGIVHVVNELPYRLKDRIKEFKIEGEQTGRTYSQNDKNGNILIRSKLDDTGLPFRDIQVWDHKVANFYVQYRKNEVHTVDYDVFVRAISGTYADNQTVDFTQRFGIPNAVIAGNTNVLFTQLVTPRVYTEVPLGRFTMSQYGTLTWRAMGANSASTNVNTISFDYLRFVPVLPN